MASTNTDVFDELLVEIAESDDRLEDLNLDSAKKTIDSDIYEALSELPENAEIEAYYGDKAWQERFINSFDDTDKIQLLTPEDKAAIVESRKTTVSKRAQNLRRDKLAIQRDAFNQTDISLDQEIGNDNIKILISALTQNHADLAANYAAFINKRLTVLLSAFIPKRLRNCMADFPKSVKACPGFLYRASEDYGAGLTFWATPDIPYYLEQGTEQKTLIGNCSKFLYSVDKAVSFYHKHEEKRRAKEFKYASTIIDKRVVTYFDLLKLNPFWFKTLYDKIVKNK